jgi:hypothetical protein
MMNWVFAVILGIALAVVAAIYLRPSEEQPIKLEDVYWGPGQPPQKTDQSIRPFKIKFTKEVSSS